MRFDDMVCGGAPFLGKGVASRHGRRTTIWAAASLAISFVESASAATATPYPNVLFAIDLDQPPRVRWKVEPAPSAAAKRVACCDLVNRGAAFDQGRVFFNTLDGQTLAVDAATGKELWQARLADFAKGETVTMAPLVVNDRVLVGNSGGEFGVRGWLAALDASSGQTVWKAWSTGPDPTCGSTTGFTRSMRRTAART